MFFNNPLNPTIQPSEEVKKFIVSECCNFSVYASTPDDFHKIHIKDSQTDEDLVMTIEFICNKCGKSCKVKKITQQELNNAHQEIDN